MARGAGTRLNKADHSARAKSGVAGDSSHDDHVARE